MIRYCKSQGIVEGGPILKDSKAGQKIFGPSIIGRNPVKGKYGDLGAIGFIGLTLVMLVLSFFLIQSFQVGNIFEPTSGSPLSVVLILVFLAFEMLFICAINRNWFSLSPTLMSYILIGCVIVFFAGHHTMNHFKEKSYNNKRKPAVEKELSISLAASSLFLENAFQEGNLSQIGSQGEAAGSESETESDSNEFDETNEIKTPGVSKDFKEFLTVNPMGSSYSFLFKPEDNWIVDSVAANGSQGRTVFNCSGSGCENILDFNRYRKEINEVSELKKGCSWKATPPTGTDDFYSANITYNCKTRG